MLTVLFRLAVVINLKVLQRMLKRLGLHKVTLFSDSRKALDYLKAMEDVNLLPDLILSDLNMPHMDGLTLVSHVRDMSKFLVRPTIMACTGELFFLLIPYIFFFW